jgi:AraC-like DNA-binding protein
LRKKEAGTGPSRPDGLTLGVNGALASGGRCVRTRNLDEAIDAVSKVYCPHTVEVSGPACEVDVQLEVTHVTSQPLVELSYGAPVAIDAGDFPRLFLMMHCISGSASTTQDHQTADWRLGQTMPFSAGLDTRLQFDRTFVQRSVRLDVGRLETLCARWLGYPLHEPLRFALRPFSAEFERIWQRTLSYLWSNEDGGLPLDGPARAAFDEFLLTLLLHQHEHNYSGDMAEGAPPAVPGLIRRAERFMMDHAEAAITVSQVAAHLGVSLRSLQAGFRQWRATTPNLALRQIRLQLVREALLRDQGRTSVTAAALRYGFGHLGRFSSYYQSAFGESPSMTLRRGRAQAS